jgi:hypothetical protein
MKTAIMQPYLFPYIGYFQLMNSVDNFVIFDDVNFIMRGWINRNNILNDGSKFLFSIPLEKPSQNKLICDTKLSFSEKDKIKFLKLLTFSYKKAPFFNEAYDLVSKIILFNETDLVEYVNYSFKLICDYIGIKTKILRSSEINYDKSLKASDKIIDICKLLGETTYVNLPNGRALYNNKDFELNKIELKFINTLENKIIYKQFDNIFIPNLSIIDILMFNSRQDVNYFVNQYDLQS